jgi:translation initiation factor IF-1
MSTKRPKRKRPGGGRPRGKGKRPRHQRGGPRPPKSDDKSVEVEGKITSVLAGTMFRVELTNGHTVLAHISGKMRKRFIRLVVGDRVKMEMSPYDKEKARITYRL